MMGFFTDEPQFFRWDTAYTPVMLEEYRRRYGEDLLDELGALFVDCEQSDRLALPLLDGDEFPLHREFRKADLRLVHRAQLPC